MVYVNKLLVEYIHQKYEDKYHTAKVYWKHKNIVWYCWYYESISSRDFKKTALRLMLKHGMENGAKWKMERIWISPSSTFLTYVHVIFQLHLHMVYIYIAAYSICKSLLDIRSVFGSRQSTDKQQRFQLSRLQAAFCKFYARYNDLISSYNISLGHMLSDMFHTNL
jgi:hypothetical protein